MPWSCSCLLVGLKIWFVFHCPVIRDLTWASFVFPFFCGRFRQLALLNMKRYHSYQLESEKSQLVAGMVQAIHVACPCSGGFLTPVVDGTEETSPVRYESMSWKEAHAQTDQVMKDAIHDLSTQVSRKEEWDELCRPPMMLHDLSLTKPTFLPLEMSVQQHLVLQRLEAGFEGSVEELMMGTVLK